jgi:CRISPR-associated protein Cas2
VLVLERVSVSLRGELTRWLLEARAGVFVGTISASVRDKLWESACSSMAGGAGMLIHNAANEQGFSVRFWGATNRWVVDYEGLTLVRVPEGS